MDKLDRIQTVHRIFSSHKRPVPISVFVDRLECSPKTVQRTFDHMRILGAPIEYCAERRGLHYAQDGGDLFELPGLWLTADELQSLILLLNTLHGFGNSMLNDELAVMESQIQNLLEVRGINTHIFSERIKILPLGHKSVPNKLFTAVGEAILKRRQLSIRYVDFRQRKSKRTLSPQTLVYYRENWYLDAWCHLRKGLRTFSLARISAVTLLDELAEHIDKATLNTHFASSYGIFAGEATQTATLRFLPPIAHEIATQSWHPEQSGTWQAGDYLLSIPYGDHRELVGDILRHMPNVIVEGPEELREEVVRRLTAGVHAQL